MATYYSLLALENLQTRGTWRATVYEVARVRHGRVTNTHTQIPLIRNYVKASLLKFSYEMEC